MHTLEEYYMDIEQERLPGSRAPLLLCPAVGYTDVYGGSIDMRPFDRTKPLAVLGRLSLPLYVYQQPLRNAAGHCGEATDSRKQGRS